MAWLYDEGCRAVVAESWEEGKGGGTQSCIKHCGNRLSRWGGDRYHKFGEKIRLLRKGQERLRGCTDPTSLTEYNRLEESLSRLEVQEDVYWRQRAKQHWLKNADANTKFYHRYASHRKRKNTLHRLMNGDGEWVEGDDMSGVVLEYFKQIFATENPRNGDLIFDNVMPRVTQAQNEWLIRPFEVDEVKSALFSMFPDKAPGPDGMNLGFYQNFWDIVGGDISSFIVNCLNTCSFPPGLNDTDVRMKPLMNDIISESQSAFISGRLITDNILVALEVGHYLNRKQCGAVGWSALKLDMAKAYDRMEWPFLRVSYSFLVNGTRSDAIMPTRGLRQATGQEAIEIKNCLSLYEKLSGQKVNFQKSSICFSRNTTDEKRNNVAQVLEVMQAPNFGKYLGLPSFIGKNKKAAFAYIEDKIRQRIGSWNKKLLSQAVFVCTAIERLMNRYWWGSGTDRKIHWTAWDKLCLPKKYGGLGFKDLKAFNVALLGKQAWRLLTNTESLVSKVYKARYYHRLSFMEAELGNNPSHCWRSIMAAKSLVCSGVKRRIVNGNSTSVWKHPWLQDEEDPMIQTEMPPQLADARVANLIDQETGTWDYHLLTDIFKPDDVSRILKIPVSQEYKDQWYWHGDPNGYYSVKNGYRRIIGNYDSSMNSGFNKWLTLWKQKIPPKWRIFIWKANLRIKRVDILMEFSTQLQYYTTYGKPEMEQYGTLVWLTQGRRWL
ncbi:PREDICTED: uncharacterized protein LOC109171740 [Ipomoea nil]|uniref:uncharacterized protein LOC109171740 n=1 Tax=Ipomoea nil TaxID=35883 RepID=UPI0009017578|nr:PREDICTED: uncharacterized protein LOC109171740 [Ipomoea nil]